MSISDKEADEAPWDEAAPAHLHIWLAVRVQHFGKSLETLLNVNPARTIALLRCEQCGDMETRTLPGTWTLEDLQGVSRESPAGVAPAERGVGTGSADGPGDVPAG